MNYTEVLNRRIKKTGMDFARSRSDAGTRREVLERALSEITEEADQTGTFLPWTEALSLLEADSVERVLLCALWALKAAGEAGMEMAALRSTLTELQEGAAGSMDRLPPWILVDGGYAALSPVVYGWLEGRAPDLPEGMRLYFPSVGTVYGNESVMEDAAAFLALPVSEGESRAFCISAEPGSGRQYLMEQICAAQQTPLLLTEGGTFRNTPRNMNAGVLCVCLYDAFPCVRLDKEIREDLLEEFTACFGAFGILKDKDRELAEGAGCAVVERTLSRPDRQLKLRIAQEVLGDLVGRLPEDVSIHQITGRQLPTGAFLRYLHNIRAELELGSADRECLLRTPVSARLNLLAANRTFAELKLPGAQMELLKKLCAMISSREEVMEQWGFGDKFSYGNGISVLFYGAPGTGKTMAAQVLAGELGMPLYRVDLSQLISKYIGETQKNIGRVFDEADKCDCILLFDEADAIFTKRSDVSDAQDRYSNAETAYLLQRIEQYGGVSILATNLLQNFDDAFRRRISYMVHFPMPDTDLRTELWEGIFPENMPVSPEVDCRMLAQAFELSGASIKNAAMHAALLARAEDTSVGMRHILDGIRNEYGKQGKNFSSSQKELADAFL